MTITYRRQRIFDYELPNAGLANATVSFFTVDSNFIKTATLATLYTDLSGPNLASNPQTLNSQGKFINPVYHEDPIIATLFGADSGVIFPLHELIYDTVIHIDGSPATAERIWRHRYVRKVEYQAAFGGSDGFADTVATATTTFDVKRSTPPGALASIGSIIFGAGDTTPSFVLATVTTIDDGDYLVIDAPGGVDDTLAGLTITLRGTRV